MAERYFFEHTADKHTLVLADDADAHVACPGLTEVPMRQSAKPGSEVDVIIGEALDCYDAGAIEEEELAAFGLVLELFNHAIVERRAALQADTLESVRGAARGQSLTSQR